MLDRKWVGAVLTAGLAALVASNGLAQDSASFSMERITVTAGGRFVSSASYDATVLAVRSSPSGAASFCNSGYVSSLGFLSTLGDFAVPIRLRLNRNAVDPSVIDLSWTGNANVFQVYRSTSPQDVLDAANLIQEISTCDGSDGPVAGNLVLYKVIAKAE